MLFVFTVIFIVISPIIVLYAKGDIFGDGWNILKTGGIYVTSAPVDSEVFINSKLEDSVSFFQRDILIKNLRPNTYNVSVKRDGYNTWENKIKVSSNMVSDANVFMLPAEVELRKITKFNTTEREVGSTTTEVKVANEEYEEVYAIFASSTLLAKKSVSTTTIDFKNNLGTVLSPIMSGKLGLWQESGKVSTGWFGRNNVAPKYLCVEFDCTKPISIFDFKKDLKRMGFLPGYDGVMVFILGNKIETMQIDPNISKVFQSLYTGTNPDFRIIDGNLYIKDGEFLAEVLL